MARIIIGSKVKHDFSRYIGTVLAFRRDPWKYNYQVKFLLFNGEYKTDWFKREVLELVLTPPLNQTKDEREQENG